ncbi:MAG: addiction module protein [Chloroflexota bacterium]
MILAEALAELLALPAADRLEIIEAMWESLTTDVANLPLTPSQRDALGRRLAEHNVTPDDVISWDEIRSSAAARHRR